jgi:hypothetical protein
MLSTKKLVGIGAAVLVAGGAAAAIIVPGASASPSVQAATTITITAPANASAGTPFTLSFAVTATSGTPTGRVIAWDSNYVTLCTLQLNPATGTGTCQATEANAGNYTIYARYIPNTAGFKLSQGSTTMTVGSGGGTPPPPPPPGNSAPAWTADTPPTVASAGQLYSYGFTASGTPAPTYSLSSSAPSWLSINATTGEVSGIVPSTPATGTFTYSVEASNSVGNVTAGPFTVTIGGASASEAVLVATISCPTFLTEGDSYSCTVSVTNSGPDTAENPVLDVTWPSLLSVTNCSGCGMSGDVLNWSATSLAANATDTVKISFITGVPSSPQASILAIPVHATTTTTDPEPFAGTAEAHLRVLA